MKDPETNPSPRHAAVETQDEAPELSRQREQWMQVLDPIMSNMDNYRLGDLDYLNETFNTDYNTALAQKRNDGESWYLAQGMNPDEALTRVEAETSTREFERRILRDVLERQSDVIETELPNFTAHLDSKDPDYKAKVDDIRQALEQAATIPRDEWVGDEDDDTGEDIGNGFIHDIAHSYMPNLEEVMAAEGPEVPGAPDNEPDDPTPVTGPVSPAVGRARVPQNNPQSPNTQPRPGERYVPPMDRRESVTNERYGAKIGDEFTLTQKYDGGVELYIHYKVAAFPAQVAGEANPPVRLQRVEQFFLNGRPMAEARSSEYTLATDHLKHLGRDVQTFDKGGQKAMELGAYWKKIDKRERMEKVKKGAKYIVGAAALFGAGMIARRAGHDIDYVTHSIGHAMDYVRDMFGAGPQSHDIAHAADAAKDAASTAASPHETFGNVDISQISPEQHNLVDVLKGNIKPGQGGLDLYKHLKLPSEQWYAQEHGLQARHPGDFYPMSDGHVGLRHPGKPLSIGAALDIAGMNRLL